MDVLCISDYLNCIDNLNLGVDAASSAGVFMKANLSDTGELLEPQKGNYDIDYYIKLKRDVTYMGVHYLSVKDMALLLTPRASTMMVLALREELPGMPLHMKLPRSHRPPSL